MAAVLVCLGLAVGLLPRLAPAWQAEAVGLLDWANDWRGQAVLALVVPALFVAAGLVRFPVSLAVLFSGLLLGPWLGSGLALLGSVSSAAVLYAVGARLGRVRVRRLAGWRVNRVNRALSRHGIMAMLVLRLMPVAGFSVVNVVAGASSVSLRDFLIGTGVGMAPGIFAMSVLGDRLAVVLRSPSPGNIAILGIAVALVLAAQVGVVSRLSRARAPAPGRSG
ncbi:MAG: VTT domain-containing protein [Magnetospirillum sp.]|nr:VTT domain-containing protein [Magnetospirillum sp.]